MQPAAAGQRPLDDDQRGARRIDLQNGFMAPGQPAEVAPAREIVPSVNRLARADAEHNATLASLMVMFADVLSTDEMIAVAERGADRRGRGVTALADSIEDRFAAETEVLRAPTDAQEGIRRTWYFACRDERLAPRQSDPPPLLFALDAELGIADRYRLDCLAGATAHGAGGLSYSGSHIGCRSGCGGSGCGGGDGAAVAGAAAAAEPAWQTYAPRTADFSAFRKFNAWRVTELRRPSNKATWLHVFVREHR